MVEKVFHRTVIGWKSHIRKETDLEEVVVSIERGDERYDTVYHLPGRTEVDLDIGFALRA